MPSAKSVKVYSTSSCPYCHMAKRFLDENKIAYTDVDVGRDRAAAAEMVRLSGQMGVPVTDIDGTIIVGFDREKIKAALGIK